MFSFAKKVRCASFIVICLIATPVHPETSLEQAFIDWADQRDMHPVALFAMSVNGTPLANITSAETPHSAMPIASISKSIAGQCALHMARQGLLSIDASISEILGWNAPQGDATVFQLLTHTSGFSPDSTQSDIFGRNLRNEALVSEIIEDVSQRTMDESLVGVHSYNNENYLILESVLAAAANTDDIVDWCHRHTPALTPLESMERANVSHALGFAGGLQLSARDLAMFFHELTLDPDWPVFSTSRNISYGPGVLIQDVSDGQNIFHTGGICLALGPNSGAFAARLVNGRSVVFLYSGCASSSDLTFLNGLVLEHLY